VRRRLSPRKLHQHLLHVDERARLHRRNPLVAKVLNLRTLKLVGRDVVFARRADDNLAALWHLIHRLYPAIGLVASLTESVKSAKAIHRDVLAAGASEIFGKVDDSWMSLHKLSPLANYISAGAEDKFIACARDGPLFALIAVSPRIPFETVAHLLSAEAHVCVE